MRKYIIDTSLGYFEEYDFRRMKKRALFVAQLLNSDVLITKVTNRSYTQEWYAMTPDGTFIEMKEMELTTEEMIEGLSKSANELVARKCQRILDKQSTIEDELKYSGSFMTNVLTGNYKMATQSADYENHQALLQALLFKHNMQKDLMD